MSKKVQISESVLRQMIVRAINESMINNPNINQHEAIYNWANVVRNGEDPIRCRAFSDFYLSMVNDYRCKQSVILGIAAEVKNQAGYNYKEEKPETFSTEDNVEGDANPQEFEISDAGEQHETELPTGKQRKLTLRILDMIYGSNIDEDILNDFFSGLDLIKKEDSIPDSFKGENVVKSVNIYFQQGEENFMTYLCRLIKFYSGHYTRTHYNDLAMQYGVGSTKIGGDKSNSIQDYNPDNDDKEISGEYELNSKSDENQYFNKMRALVARILNDGTIGLGPQEKKLLQCLLDVSNEQLNPERLERMQSLSPTQQNQEIYQEMSERTGIEVDKIKRSLSAAIQKAKQSKYAKMLEEKKKQIAQKILNEVMNKILNK